MHESRQKSDNTGRYLKGGKDLIGLPNLVFLKILGLPDVTQSKKDTENNGSDQWK